MGRARTRRKNAQKRRKRRAFATINAEIRAHVRVPPDSAAGRAVRSCSKLTDGDANDDGGQEEDKWTAEALELEQMREEEARQQTHEQWRAAVDRSACEFERQRRIQQERQELVRSIRQVQQHTA